MSKQLKKYIQKALKPGQAKEKIGRSLTKADWLEKDVDETLGNFKKTPPLSQDFFAPNITQESSFVKTFLDSFKMHFKKFKAYYALAFLVLAVFASLFLYQKIFLKEKFSEFELTPKIADAAGIEPETSFILKSSADLSATIIEKYLNFEPDVKYKIKKIGSESSIFEITPVNSLLENTVYSVVINKGPIAMRTYSWAYQVKAPFQVIGSLPRDKAIFVPTNTGIEINFNRENIINPQSSFEISPPVRGRFNVHRNTLIFVPLEELAPMSIYTVKIKSGLKAQDSDDILAEDVEIKFETTERSAGAPQPFRQFFDFLKKFWEFKPDAEIAFEIRHYNLSISTVSLTVYKLNDVNEFIETYKGTLKPESSWAHYSAHKPVSLPSNKKVFESDVPLEKQARAPVIRIPQKLSEGFYIAEVAINNERSQVWFQVTPIASFSAVSGTKTLLWLKELPDGNNVANAEVSFEGKKISSSNNDGVAMFDTPPQLIRERNEQYWHFTPPAYFYTVISDEKQLAIPVENEWSSFFKVNPPDSWWDYFSTDKTIYLLSDKIYFWGIVKQRNGTDIKGEKVTIQLTNPFWRNTSPDDITAYGETSSVISDFYTLTGSITFSDLSPGLYQLNVKRGDEIIVSETINVKAYIKPAYRLTLIPDKNAVFAGDEITYKVKAEFFEGTPVANLKLKYRGYFNQEINGEVQLNQNGEGSFVVKADYLEKHYAYWPRYFGMTISPAIAEEGEIAANASVLVFGPTIDLRGEQTISGKISRFSLNLKNIVLDKVQKGDPWWISDNYLGSPIPNWSVVVDVVQIIYHREQINTGYDLINKTTYPIYRHFTEERLIRQDNLTTDEHGKASYQWMTEEGKTYRITFTAKDAAGKQVKNQYYVYGESSSYFSPYDTQVGKIKNLDESKSRYKLGNKMHLQIQDISGNVLESGPGKFIFIKMVNGIDSYQITDSPNYNDNFKETYIPNIEIMGAWFSRSRSFFSHSQSINLSFDSDERRLNVEIAKDKDRYRPRDKVNLRIKITDKDGNPKQAEVNIAGVDEAVFSLNPIEKDITNLLYQNIWTSPTIRSSHLMPLESGAEMGACFLPNTMVLTPIGEKAIKDLRVGDEVLTRKNETSTEMARTKVKQVSSHLVSTYLVINNKLRLTPNHQLFVNGFWKQAREVKIGNTLITQNGNSEKIVSLELVQERGLVYNIELEDYYTYFANGVYVHNKGDGMERANFRDLAIYESLYTDSKGQGQASFDLPDNLTSWRITAQAITKDLFVGKNVNFVPVGLPFFVESTFNQTYLAGDNLDLRTRVFGTANIQNNISYTVESKTLPFGKIERTGGNVIEIPLGTLVAGEHQIKISARFRDYNDIIIRNLNVLTSYFSQNTSEFYELSPSLTNIQGSARGYTTLSFISYEKGRFYNQLRRLSYQKGPRLDQKLTEVFAKSYLNTFFGETNELENIDVLNYQYQGGATLLPYSDADLELSAKFANLIQGEQITANPERLKQYFYSSLNDRKADLSRISAALYGLSSFKEPVLVTVQNIKNDRNLALEDRIYLALALDNLGAKEEAREYYRTKISSSLTARKPYVFVNRLPTQDENIIATILLAGLATSLSETEAEGLGRYAIENYPKNTLKNFEMLLYMRAALPLLKSGDVSFSYQALQKKGKKTLKNDETFQLELSKEELAVIKFSNITGRIGLISSFKKESTPEKAKKDMSISLSRMYSVDGQQTTQFNEGDLVRVDLVPTFKPDSFEGSYQVVDYLPSGLRAVTNIQTTPFREDGRYPRYPSSIDGQKITFVVWKNFSRPFFYYARVVSKGDYKAEPALIQSLRSAESSNVSNETKITIK